MYNSTLREQMLRKIQTLIHIISDPDGFRCKSTIINIDDFDLPIVQLRNETSKTLIAREVYRMVSKNRDVFVPQKAVEMITPKIDPDIVLFVREDQLCSVFNVHKLELRALSDWDLLLSIKDRSQAMYDWNQVRKLYGRSPNST